MEMMKIKYNKIKVIEYRIKSIDKQIKSINNRIKATTPTDNTNISNIKRILNIKNRLVNISISND